MGAYLSIDVNVFALFICAGLYAASVRLSDKHMMENALFRVLIVTVMVLLALESVVHLADGQSGAAARIFNHFSHAAYLILAPVPGMMWAFYASFQIFHSLSRLKKEMIIFTVPLAMNALLALSSIFSNLFFSIDSSNTYHRGPLFLIFLIAAFVPIVYTVVLYAVKRKSVPRNIFVAVIAFAFVPVCGAVIQILYPSVTVTWISLTVSLFIVQTAVLSRQYAIDHLTGIYNRRQLDSHITSCIASATHGKDFSCIMLDIDNFKSINDTFSHVTGDNAITDAAQILQSSIRKGDFLSRYAGDEFVIILDVGDEAVIRQTIRHIQEAAAAFNCSGKRPYRLAFSAGYKIYSHGSGVTREDFIARVDAMMYQNKRMRKDISSYLCGA